MVSILAERMTGRLGPISVVSVNAVMAIVVVVAGGDGSGSGDNDEDSCTLTGKVVMGIGGARGAAQILVNKGNNFALSTVILRLLLLPVKSGDDGSMIVVAVAPVAFAFAFASVVDTPVDDDGCRWCLGIEVVVVEVRCPWLVNALLLLRLLPLWMVLPLGR